MFRRAVIAATTALLVMPLAAAGMGTASAQTWFATSTQGLHLTNATRLGPLAGNTPLHISVALPLRNQAALAQYIRNVNTVNSGYYGRSLTPSQFLSNYGPTASSVQAVRNYLANQGFTKLFTSGNHLYVTGTATASQVQAAFNTTIDRFNQKGKTVYANVTPAMVPASVRNFIIAVVGLNDLKMALAPLDTSIPNAPASYWAPGFQKAYDATGVTTGFNTTIAIMAEGDVSQVVTDLRLYEKDKNNTSVSQVPVNVIHTGISTPDTAGLVEWDMDTQTSTGLAGAVKALDIYDAPTLTDGDVALEFNKFVTQDQAKAASASFGECEYLAYLDGFMVANDEAMSEAAAQGQTLFASAGDSGGFCGVTGLTNGVPGGEPFVNYPASSPYVVAVGGTTLLTNTDGSYNQEAAWAAGGGGPSYFEYQPFWQNGVSPPTSTSCVAQVPACLGRNVPDIAMDADFLLAAANFYNAGQPTSNGGTSLASPLALGAWARLETAHTNGIGFAAPNLYNASGSTGFHDVTLGDTGPYPALPGWDYATGNGSFDIKQMVSHIISHPPIVVHYPVPAPACTLFYDQSGDANPTGSTGNVDSLDVLSAGMSSDTTHKTLTAILKAKSLDDGPAGTTALAGTADSWYLLFSYKNTTFFLNAEYDPASLTPWSYSYGHLTQLATSTSYQSDGTLTTGSVDTANGLIKITAPWADFGSQLSPVVPTPAAGTNLPQVTAQTFEVVGAAGHGSLQGADSAGVGAYQIGASC